MLIYDNLSAPPSERKYTPEGFLIVPAVISRSGIQVYSARELGIKDVDSFSRIAVYRPPEEVLATDSVESFARKSVTNGHPGKMVTSDNAAGVVVGMSSDTVTPTDKEELKTVLTIFDGDAIAAVEKGRVYISNGYNTDINFESGVTPEGHSYQAVQRNIRGNHIALVDNPRGGTSLHLSDSNSNPQERNKMPTTTVIIDQVPYETNEQVASAVMKIQDSLDSANAKVEELTSSHTAEIITLKAKLDDAITKLEEASGKLNDTVLFDEKVNSRLTLIQNANNLYPGIKWEGKSDHEIRKEAVEKKIGKSLVDSAEIYVQARFDILVEDSEISNSGNSNLNQALLDSGNSPVDDTNPANEARTKFIKDVRNAWKKTG